MKEIGGYFGLEKLISHEYYPDLIPVNNARNGLVYLARIRGIKKLYIPYFLCDSVSGVCRREGIPFEYYHIDERFMPVFENELAEGEWLYIVNYYGQFSNETAAELNRKYKRIIFDNVQAFFQKPVFGIDTVYSCRKFFGVPDGGYVSTDSDMRLELPKDFSKDRMKHLLGRFEDETANLYYSDFKANDHGFKETELRSMSAITHNLLGAIDYGSVMRIRNENYAFLHQALGPYNKLKITSSAGPYAYPLYCENGHEIRKRLAEKKIYVATLWPNVIDMHGCLEKDYAENILPLPCDQRYDLKSMHYLVQELSKHL